MIKQYCKPLKQFVDIADPVWKAWRVMKETGVKHLPVKKNDRIVGVVSDRDIIQISGYNGGQSMAVKEAMSLDPLILLETCSFSDALSAMLKKDQQQAIVVDGDQRICGLFTWDVAFRVFMEFGPLEAVEEASIVNN